MARVVYRDENYQTFYVDVNAQQPEVTIGRNPSNKVQIPTKSLSRYHAKIVYQNSRYFLYDLKSSNGTFVNNQRITQHEIVPGDKIRFGDVNIEFIDETRLNAPQMPPMGAPQMPPMGAPQMPPMGAPQMPPMGPPQMPPMGPPQMPPMGPPQMPSVGAPQMPSGGAGHTAPPKINMPNIQLQPRTSGGDMRSVSMRPISSQGTYRPTMPNQPVFDDEMAKVAASQLSSSVGPSASPQIGQMGFGSMGLTPSPNQNRNLMAPQFPPLPSGAPGMAPPGPVSGMPESLNPGASQFPGMGLPPSVKPPIPSGGDMPPMGFGVQSGRSDMPSFEGMPSIPVSRPNPLPMGTVSSVPMGAAAAGPVHPDISQPHLNDDLPDDDIKDNSSGTTVGGTPEDVEKEDPIADVLLSEINPLDALPHLDGDDGNDDESDDSAEEIDEVPAEQDGNRHQSGDLSAQQPAASSDRETVSSSSGSTLHAARSRIGISENMSGASHRSPRASYGGRTTSASVQTAPVPNSSSSSFSQVSRTRAAAGRQRAGRYAPHGAESRFDHHHSASSESSIVSDKKSESIELGNSSVSAEISAAPSSENTAAADISSNNAFKSEQNEISGQNAVSTGTPDISAASEAKSDSVSEEENKPDAPAREISDDSGDVLKGDMHADAEIQSDESGGCSEPIDIHSNNSSADSVHLTEDDRGSSAEPADSSDTEKPGSVRESAENDSADADIIAAKTELTSARLEIEALHAEIEALKAAPASDDEDLRSQIDELRREISELQDAHQQAAEELKSAHRQELEAAKTVHSEEIDALKVAHEQEIYALNIEHEQELESLNISNTVELSESEASNESLREKLAEAESKLSEAEAKIHEFNDRIAEYEQSAKSAAFVPKWQSRFNALVQYIKVFERAVDKLGVESIEPKSTEYIRSMGDMIRFCADDLNKE